MAILLCSDLFLDFFFIRLKMKKDVLGRLSQMQDAIAPKHLAKQTLEDDIGMVHEFTQVR